MAYESDHLFQPPSCAEFAAQLQRLREKGSERFQSARFSQMERLLARAEAASDGVQLTLLSRLEQWLADYSQQLASIQAEVEVLLANHSQPDAQLQSLLDAGDWQTARRQLLAQQSRSSFQPHARHQLRTLSSELSAPTLQELPVDDAQALDDEMLALEQAARTNQLELPLAPSAAAPVARPDLKAVRRYKQLAQQQKTESMVNRAIMTRPENPGPLNPHMLAIKSLVNMRDLSSAYLNRFVSYIETVLWLEDHIDTTPATREPARASRKPPRRGKTKV